VAAYHAISGGVTEDAANIWTGSAPYLVPVESDGDRLAPGYESTVLIPTEELRKRLVKDYPAINLPEDPAAWFGAVRRTESGYVQEIEAGDITLHGKDIRLLLGLRSHNFEVLYTERGFEFVVVGYGHGVGLSQHGADYMARQGAGYREILEAYYTGAEVAERP
jgi:stage II sporulation protein D